MLKFLNIFLTLVILVLAVLLYKSLTDPVKFNKAVAENTEAVHNKLYKIRDAQEAYRTVTDNFAPNFDTLEQVLAANYYVFRNPVTRDSTRVSMLDSLFKGDVQALQDLDKVPNGKDNASFIMDAGVLESPSDSTVFIPVFEAYTNNEVFLHNVNDDYWYKNRKVRMGSLTAPILTGNWER